MLTFISYKLEALLLEYPSQLIKATKAMIVLKQQVKDLMRFCVCVCAGTGFKANFIIVALRQLPKQQFQVKWSTVIFIVIDNFT